MHIGAGEFASFGKMLADYDRQTTVSKIAALCTIPALHPHSIRLETLLHLACLHCSGQEEASTDKILSWINNDLQSIAHLEDPVSDVFIGNVMGPGGNYRLFNGIWEGSDFYVQSFIDTITHGSPPTGFAFLHHQIFSLLKLSDIAVSRCGLNRWTVGAPVPKRYLSSSSIGNLTRRARLLLFSRDDLSIWGIKDTYLEPFILNEQHLNQLQFESVGNSSLERYPLLRFKNEYLLSSPSSISPAIRRYILEWMKENKFLPQFASMLRLQQGHRVLNDGLQHLETVPVDDDIPLHDHKNLASIDQVVCTFDVGKYAQIVLIHDSVAVALEEGLDVPQEFEKTVQRSINSYLMSSLQSLKAKSDCIYGMTIIISCGVGRGYAFAAQKWPDDWHYCVFSIAGFLQLADSSDISMLRLWKLLEHYKRVTQKGLDIPIHHIGFLNLFSFWKAQKYCIVPDEMPYPKEHTLLQISTDFLLSFNRDIRLAHDKHAAFIEYPSRVTAVIRLLPQSYFETITKRPIYASLPAVERKELDGLVETRKGRYWVLYRKKHEGQDASKLIYQLWEAMLFWLDRLLPEIEASTRTADKPIYVEFYIKSSDTKLDLDFIKEDGEAAEVQVAIDNDKRYLTLEIPILFLRYFNVSENIAERKLLTIIGKSIKALLINRAGVNSKINIEAMVQKIMNGTAARMVHIFETQEPEDILGSIDPQKARLIQVEDENIVLLGLAWEILPGKEQNVRTIIGEDVCKKFLSNIVDKLWKDIEKHLSSIDRESVIKKALSNIEGINQDQTHWKHTAKAMLALYREDDVIDKALEKDTERNIASIASRVLVEMALCAAPLAGGRRISTADFDELLARIRLMVEFASDSDAIHHKISAPEIKIAPNGLFQCDRSYILRMVGPFVTDSFATGFNAAAEAYSKLHEKKQNPEQVAASSVYPSEFASAFTEEYGLDPDRVIDAIAELLSLASVKNKIVVQTTHNEISQLLKSNRNFTEKEIQAFFDSFSLSPRERWDSTPKGFRGQDWWPWRFRRRLSLVVRPLAVLSNDTFATVIYGVSHMADSFRYIFGRIESAWLPQEFFKSKLMQQYIGNKANVLGHEFAREVIKELQTLDWQCRLEVQMTELGASSEMGDVDVVAWRKDDNRLMLIECKRLQPTRTIWEIGDLVSEFKGQGGDRLAKHVKRCEWINANIYLTIAALKIPQRSYSTIPLVVTNAQVPFKFWKDLAIPTDNIIEISSLKAWFRKSK